MALSEPYSQSALAVSGTELSIISGTSSLQAATTGGSYQLVIDPVGASMAKTDEFEIKVYEKVRASGTQRVLHRQTFLGAQDEHWVFPAFMLINGFDFTMKKLAGTDRNFDVSVRGVTGNVSTAYSQTALSVSTTELAVGTGTSSMQTDTTPGVFQFFADLSQMAKNDIFEFRAKDKARAGTERTMARWRLAGIQSELFCTPSLILYKGWDFTVKRLAGADRTFDLSIRKIG